MIAMVPAERPQAAPEMVRAERLHPLQNAHEEQEGQPRRDGDSIARTDTAHSRNGAGAEDEQAEEDDRQDQVGH